MKKNGNTNDSLFTPETSEFLENKVKRAVEKGANIYSDDDFAIKFASNNLASYLIEISNNNEGENK